LAKFLRQQQGVGGCKSADNDPGGSDPSCPIAGSIGCLLLQFIGSLQGPRGGKILTKTTFVQWLNTNGGSAPDSGCAVSGDVGHQALVPYTADYFFFCAGNLAIHSPPGDHSRRTRGGAQAMVRSVCALAGKPT
jgi:Protein of unknown function (DUF3455)